MIILNLFFSAEIGYLEMTICLFFVLRPTKYTANIGMVEVVESQVLFKTFSSFVRLQFPPELKDVKICLVKASLCHTVYTVVCFYRPPNYDDVLSRSLITHLRYIFQHLENLVVCGDLNCQSIE